MANEFIIKNGFHSKGDSQITGSLSITGGSSGSFSGSFQGDGSSLTGVGAFPFTGDAQITGSLTVSGSFIPHGIGPTSNTVIGVSAGAALTAGSTENIMIGKEAGEAQASGDSNIMIGVKAGEASTNDSNCILIGRKAGGASTLGNNNIFIGYEAGRDCSSTHGSIGIGAYALFESNDGGGSGYNAAFGYASGYSMTSGTYNLFLGYKAGYDITTGANNVIIGSGSLGETGTTDQLRIGNGNDLITISASLVTGDIIFPSTASAQYYTTPAGQISTISSSYALTASHALNAGGGGGIFNQTGSIYSTTNDLQITGSLFVTQLTASSVDIESLPLINPIVEYYNTTVVTSSGTTVSLPNSLTFVSSSTYEYLEVFINGLRMRYDMDFIPATTASVTYFQH